jgi:Zn finger protein HypA/HybF involved in hydrogenase expression
MHEYSIIQQLIEKLLAQAQSQGGRRVKQVHLRRGSTFSVGPLLQAFQMLTPNTPLQNAELVIDEFSTEHQCHNCGRSQAISSDDLIGHLFICPGCGFAEEIDEAHGLELVRVTFASET